MVTKAMKPFVFALVGTLALGSHLVAADPKGKKKLTFDDDIAPMLREKCGNCHNPDKKSSGLIVTNYQKLMEGGAGGVCVKPGDPDNSTLYTVVAHKAEPFMPPRSPKLPDEYANKLQQWILEGALENSGSKAPLMKPKADISLGKVSRGRPEGPPPLPVLGPNAKFSLDPVRKTPRANAIIAMAASPWAPLVAIGGNKQIILQNSDTREVLAILPFPEGTPTVLKFSRNGSLLLAGGGRGAALGRAVVWNVQTGERIIQVGEETDSVLAADISPDQTMIALGGPSKMVRIHSTRDGKILHQIKKHTDWITALEFSPDGVLLATGDRSGGLFVWEAFTAREYYGLRGHTAQITDISWRPDSNVVASASEDTTVRLWEMENGGQIKSWGAHGGGALSVRYGMDGNIVTAGRDRQVKFWDGNGTLKKAYDAMPDLALKAVLSHDSSRAIGGDWAGNVLVWQAADGKRLGELTANPDPLPERVLKLGQSLKAAQDGLEASKKKAPAVTQKLQGIAAELAQARKLQGDPNQLIKPAQAAQAAAQAKVNEVKAQMAQAAAARKASEMIAAEMGGVAQRLAAAKPADPAGQQAAAEAVKRANELNQKAQADLAAARKRETDYAPVVAAAEKALADANASITTAQQQAQQLPKRVEALVAAEKAAQGEMAAVQAEIKSLEAEVANLQGQLQRAQGLLTAQTTKK